MFSASQLSYRVLTGVRHWCIIELVHPVSFVMHKSTRLSDTERSKVRTERAARAYLMTSGCPVKFERVMSALRELGEAQTALELALAFTPLASTSSPYPPGVV